MKQRKPKLIFDSNPLILVAKTSLLRKACTFFEVHIPGSVRDEATSDPTYPDSVTIKDLPAEGLIEVHQIKDEKRVAAFQRHPDIHRGEAETLALAQELDATAVMGDGEARAIAKLYTVAATPGTLSILSLLVTVGHLTPAEAEAKLEDMVDAGLHLDSRTLVAARRRLRDYGSR